MNITTTIWRPNYVASWCTYLFRWRFSSQNKKYFSNPDEHRDNLVANKWSSVELGLLGVEAPDNILSRISDVIHNQMIRILILQDNYELSIHQWNKILSMKVAVIIELNWSYLSLGFRISHLVGKIEKLIWKKYVPPLYCYTLSA